MKVVLLVSPALLTALLCWGVIRLGIKDAPDGGRKTQKTPVPTAGGLGLAGLLFLAFLSTQILKIRNGGAWPSLEESINPVTLFIIPCFVIGLWDDVVGIGARWKLLGIALLALLVTALSDGFVNSIPLPGLGEIILPSWFAILGAALFIFVITNATNFMDGSDGLAMGSAAIMLFAMLICLGLYQSSTHAPFEDVLESMSGLWVLAIPGFLFWNLRGELYAGDTGALPVGALIGMLGLYITREGQPVWVPVIIALPFLIDILLTMAWRVKHGRNMMQAHRDHAYQLLVRAGWPHWKVALLWWGFSAICGIAAMGLIYAQIAHANVLRKMGSVDYGANSFWLFLILLTVGTALWVWQRVTLGRRLEREGR